MHSLSCPHFRGKASAGRRAQDHWQQGHRQLELQNTYTNKIQSARAAMFLIDNQDKVIGQLTNWIIGGGKDKPSLESNSKTIYNFGIATDKPFTKTRLIVTRILLDNGKLASLKDVQILSANSQERSVQLPTNK
jgi:hypothetical protein